jgi:cyclopropane-fatty-acyl-phospholipid synthase
MKKWITNRVFAPIAQKADITCIFPDGVRVGSGQPVVQFLSWGDIFRIAINPSLGFADAWGHGRIKIDDGDLADVMQKVMFPGLYKDLPLSTLMLTRLRQMFSRLTEGWTTGLSRRNVHHHYDIGNELYALFLDEDWQYSCAYFEKPGISLGEAQSRKREHIARKLRLDGSQRVLDIGCGWGGLALHLAQQSKSVIGITLSEEQLKLARKRAQKSKASVKFDLRDYRKEERRFDRVVSVGMLEHVGRAQLPQFFRSVSRCLEDDGVAMIHTIGRVGEAVPTDSFISKYIFPGGYLPSLSQLTKAIEQTDLAVSDTETLFLHYAETLRHWRERFMSNRDKAVAMYDEFFARIWELYLAGSEANFRQGNIVVYQIQLLKRKAERPFNRAYIYPSAPAHK